VRPKKLNLLVLTNVKTIEHLSNLSILGIQQLHKTRKTDSKYLIKERQQHSP